MTGRKTICGRSVGGRVLLWWDQFGCHRHNVGVGAITTETRARGVRDAGALLRQPWVRDAAATLKAKNVNLLFAFVAVLLFCFSCFCISKMNQTSNELINCRNHILGFKENMLRLKNKHENNHQNLVQVLNQVKYEITQTANTSGNLVERKVNTLSGKEILPNGFEDLKFFLPYLRTMGKIYPDVATGRGKAGVSFALGITTIDRRQHSYLKQTLTSILSRMTPEEEKDSVVIVSVADTDDYLNYVLDMVKTKFKRQVQSGSLEVISIPTFFYPSILLGKKAKEDSDSWQMKQVLDCCILMLYAQPKATYYLQLEDDIIARKMYFTKMKDFVNSLTSKNWLFIEFSVLGLIGKLFQSKDLLDFVHFFLMFYKVKPIDMLLEDIFLVKMCNLGEHFRRCMYRKKDVRVQYRPSLFQHVGIQSSFPGRQQHLKVRL
ncbi:alpha-1,3-mannosyl-glycoprotein 4-beta-N-acetylglucosaminyltransferase-like protein MGAT4D isoform X2 [Cricetulus griseus]|uniref:Alpha-1,3-mannosyl-glycoprotein 4-beta-N-acetylglucosaminyltransferase-like protein MGAT4D isoform X2 n=1 Tax=Cricetulus griseus TaxID=10029 RepID=A0A9J7FKM2_CRIGR|nr:alpha-1,3-mannosyl-glycoprotein 4-beta-N-acetylglucosaminyltransferase-like protein MGAT4D isoform X2 [Cricetulus griseus]